MDVLFYDFETFYDRDYSLSKLTTEEYLRDPRFEIIGVAVKRNGESTQWFSGSKRATEQWLRQFDWGNAIAVAHNAMFDAAIFGWHLNIHPKRLADTLSMARAIHGNDISLSLASLSSFYGLGEKGTEVVNALGMRRADFTPERLQAYADYCIKDVELTASLFLALAQDFPASEMRLIDTTIRMFSRPLLELDGELLKGHLTKVQTDKEALLSKVLVGKDTLMSNPKLAELLQSLGVSPPTKISPTTGKETWAFGKTDEAFRALLEHEDLLVQNVVGARLGVKSTLEETRTQRFIDIAQRGPLPVPLRYYAAHTGRWGGCLVDDTQVLVYNATYGVETKRIVDVLLDDLVWDGEEFVPHEGVVFSGYSEVIEWDGVKGTEDHVVFTDAGEMPLRAAMQGGHRIQAAKSPCQDALDAAEQLVGKYKAAR